MGLYGKNDLTLDQIKAAGNGFSQATPFESQLHGEGNLKFTSDESGRSWWNRYGRTEIVVSPNVNWNGNSTGYYTHVQNSNMGTLNYGRNPISHTMLDFVPHFIWGHPSQ